MILAQEKLTELLQAYPPERQHTLAVFQDIQKECGYLPKEHIVAAADYLKVPLSQAYAMATFYHTFSLTPRGKHVIKVCDGTACHIKDSKGVLQSLERLLGVGLGGTDADGLFTIETVACLGCCALAPAMQIGEEYYGNLTDEIIAEVIADYRRREAGEVVA
ncbi:MAG: NADH-quinone oxidoreductase subunit NuoE [Coriobacteriia bacterium]|nr:NADH-quinone oxidoreductase subunit NuoE [Coriobacteriia bacterium]